MPLLEDRTGIKATTPMPTHDVTNATSKLQVSAEAVSFADGAAGTTQRIKLTYDGVMDANGERIGVDGNTSFAFITGTVLTTQVPWRFKNTEGKDTETDRLASMANGEFMMDHENGYILGKSATSTSTSTDTVNYKVRLSATTVVGSSGYAEDSAHVSGDSGTQILSVRRDTPVASAAAGDYATVNTDANGALYARIITSAGASVDTFGYSLVDDAAFTPATSSVVPTGFLADETATDSVDEGDVGIGRMTLDRKQIIANQLLDDAAFGVGTGYVGVIGGLADETSTDSVDEGDTGAIRMSLRRAIKSDADTLQAGEDLTNNVMKVEGQFTGTQCTADTQVKATAGFLHTITLQGTDATPTAGTIVIYDSAAESGTEICRFDIKATAVADAFDGASMILDRICTTGIYVGFTTTTDVAVQVTWR